MADHADQDDRNQLPGNLDLQSAGDGQANQAAAHAGGFAPAAAAAASGDGGAMNPLPPGLSSYSYPRPFEYNHDLSHLDPVSPFPALGPAQPGCAFPNHSVGRYLPFQPTNTVVGHSDSSSPWAASASVNPSFFFPPPQLPVAAASTWSPVPPYSATAAPTQNLDLFSCAGSRDLARGTLQMPVQQGNFNSLGDAYNSFGLSGGSNAVYGGQSAPPQLNQHHNLYNHNNLGAVSNPAPTSSDLPQLSGTYNHHAPSLHHAPWSTSYQTAQSQPLGALAGLGDNYLDDFTRTLLANDFSSPSLPPHGSSPPRLSNTATQTEATLPARTSPIQIVDSNMPGRSRAARASDTNLVDLTSPKLEHDGEPGGVDPATPMRARGTRKRSRAAASTGSTAGTTQRRASTASRQIKPLKRSAPKTDFDDDSLFGGSSPAPLDDDVLDLTGTDELPPELMKPKVDNRTKLSKFNCSICMDNPTDLTVTHCGHLFCSECLHSALHIDSIKRTCPLCRQKVEIKTRVGQKTPKNGFFHLELKLMTANRKGKRPVGQ
ncbi:hypothetical protein BJ166DRAFT_108263 [Pestalotiopsis sp. NC0098]|nr:hypothetical protein BJ166DRAFT_108263 [Pestalotiopsis sp. NC0098]